MTLEQKIGQLFLISVVGKTAPIESSIKVLRKVPVGGVILFAYNLRGGPAQVASLNRSLQEFARSNGAKLPYFIAVDQEGGRVQRLKKGFTRLPAPRVMGQLPNSALQNLGQAVAAQLLAVGVNLNLAPVVEAAAGDHDVIGDRSFAASPEQAALKAAAFISGMQQAGVLATAKHFPGNAGSDVDPHHNMPVIRLSRAELQRELLPPFRAAIAADVDAIMVSHVVIPDLDPDHPVALSAKVVQQLLRQELGFDGLICSDDLLMGAVIKNSSPSQAAILAIHAGTDLLMVSNPAEVPAMHQALVQAVRDGQLEATRVDAAVRRILGKKLQRDLIASADALRQNKGLSSLHKATKQGDAIVKPLEAQED